MWAPANGTAVSDKLKQHDSARLAFRDPFPQARTCLADRNDRYGVREGKYPSVFRTD